MKKIIFFLVAGLPILSCNQSKNDLKISLSDKNIELIFFVNQKGEAGYLIEFKNKRVIDTSYFGREFQNEKPFANNLEVVGSSTSSFDRTWETV